MRLRASFWFAILACAVAFNIATTHTALAQQPGGKQFAGQQFSGQYPNIAPSQSPNAMSAGPGYYAAAMQASGRTSAPMQTPAPAPMSAPPTMPRTYPAAPTQFAPPTAPQVASQSRPPAAAPASGPFAGLKNSLGRFANPSTPPVPAVPAPAQRPAPSPRQQAWTNPGAPAPFNGTTAGGLPGYGPTSNAPRYNGAPAFSGAPPAASFPTQTAGYNAQVSPYAEYAASVAARAAREPGVATQASYTAAANAAARPSVALQTRGPGPGAAYLTANNQPTLAPGFSGDDAPPLSAQVLAAPGLTAPTLSGPSYGAASYGAPAPTGVSGPVGGGFVGPGNYGQGNYGQGNFGQPNYGQGGYGAPGMPGTPNSSMWQQPVVPDPVSSGNFGGAPYGDPNFMPPSGSGSCDPGDPDVSYFDPGVPSCGPWFASISGLIMTRDVPNNVGLAYQGADPHIASILNTETAGFDWRGGVEGKIGRMIGDRWAMELVYWGVDPSNGYLSARSDTNDINSRLDMQNVFYQGAPLSDIYSNSHEQRVYRADSFQNVEINILQQALAVDPRGRFGVAYFSGARYFQYREILEYYAVQAGAEFSDNDPATQSAYHIRVRNSLIGWQIGARGHVYLGNRLRLYATPRVGLFANAISQQQDLCMVINVHSTKTDVAMLGQIDLGASFQVFRCCSIFAGYRAMAIAGVANGDDQVARTFNSLPDLANINSSGSIILHGVNTGVQFQF